MDVSAALEAHKSKFKPTTVEKDTPLGFDLHHLAAFDNNPLEDAKLNSAGRNNYLLELNRDNAQLLVNEIFALPTISTEDGVMATLPRSQTYILPREKALPKPKPKTRWETFAEQKGIQKKTKKERMVHDEETDEYKPAWGYGRARQESGDDRDWLLEVPQNADPMEDQFAKKREEKKEKVEKNKKRQKRNLEEAAAADGKRFPSSDPLVTAAAKVGVVGNVGKQAKETPGAAPDRVRKTAVLERALKISGKSTASIGKFDRKLKEDAKVKTRGVRRKFEPVEGPSKKRSRNED